MNRFFKKTLSMLLAVLMIFGSAPQIVFAMMPAETEICEDEHCEEHSHEEEIAETPEISSDYEEDDPEEIPEEPSADFSPEETESVSVCSVNSVNSVDEAALYLREQMIARNPSVTLRLQGSVTDSEVSAILTKAWEHNGIPNCGDYIRHNQIGYSYDYVTGEDENGAYGEITYTINWLTTAEQEAEVDAAVDAVLAELDLWDKTEYEKIKGAYDWITENVQYDFNNEDNDEYELCHSTYAAIILKDAVCQGYATLFYRFMLELGVDCRYISGMAGYVEVERHAWNIVRLEDKYYNMDATWDRDLMGHYRMFLCTESNFTEHHPDSEYLTAEWKAKYPMAVVPYVFNVTASGKLSNGMEWVLDGDTGTLTVAGKGAIPSYRYSYAPWYQYRESVKSIVVSEGITEVGERAFYWCTNCTSLSLPSTLTAIREYGFNNLRALEYVTLPENLKTMEFCAFSECVALKEIVIPDSVTTCGTSTFSNCYGLQKAVIGAGLKQIPDSMFFGDRNLKEVTLPEGLTYIGDTAFSDCGLFNFTIPATLTGLGTSVFGGCRRLSEFYVESGNQYYKAVDGVLFTKDGKTLVAYSMGDISSYYYVPEGTEVIARSAFNDSYRLESVYFPESLKTIEPYAFAYCGALWSVKFTENITRIGDSAFRSCTSLYSVRFENPSVTLESAVFANCDYLEIVTLPKNLKEIPSSLFYGCAKLDEITIPSTVTKIGSSAFLDCDSLKSITIPGTVKTIEQQAFDYCDKLETVTMQEGVQKIGWLAFSRNPKLKKVVIPSSVTTIENKSSTDWTFIECPNVVLYVTCGTAGWNYARSKGLAHSDTHRYSSQTVVPPTCTAQGYTIYSCACGASYKSNYTSALGHSYSEKITPPTCTEQGYTTLTCVRCGYSYNLNFVEALGHSLVLIGYIAPTCTEPGYSGDQYCENCDFWIAGEEIPAEGHYYEEFITEPTCTEKGYTTHICFICGDSYVDSYVDAKGHTEGEKVIEKEVPPTCGKDGSHDEVVYCEVCGAELSRKTVVDKATGDHVYSTEKERKEPTCTEDGYVIMACACGATEKTVLPAKGHSYKETTVPPTCTEQGYTAHTCQNCGDSYVDSYVPALGHKEVTDAAKEPTCTETGLTEGKHCERCGEILVAQNVVPALGHKEIIDAAKEPTCTETGLTEGKHCERCGEVLVAQNVVPALGHKEITDAAKEPTCTETGLTEGKHCDRCETVLVEQNVVPALGHKEVTDAAKEATCTETGLTEGKHCERCGTVLVAQNVVPALGHKEITDAAKEPTCTETGLTEGKHCERCGTVLVVQEVVPAAGHKYESVVTEPTCTEQGYTTHTCSVCGDSYIDSHVEAKGHTFGEWYTVTEATPTEPGEERRDCENCDYFETREIPAKGYEAGDINLDGSVDVKDAYYARLIAAKLIKPTEQQIELGDVDRDGKITAIDANIVRKFVVKIITSIPLEQ